MTKSVTPLDIRDHQRIVVLGNGGSGKTWLATRLADATGYPLLHLDRGMWQPGWIMRTSDEVAAWTRAITIGDRWIIEGDHDVTTSLRWDAADLVILVDVNRVVCILNVVKRNRRDRPDLPDGIAEPSVFSHGFWHFCRHIWAYPKGGRRTVMVLHEQQPDKSFVRLTSRRAMRRFTAATLS